MPDGKVLDVFYVEPPQYPVVSSDKRLLNVQKKWDLLAQGTATADSLILERLRQYPLKRLRTVMDKADVHVSIDNGSSLCLTIVEIKTADNFGLLHRIVQCLNKNNVNISSARLSTRVDQAVDVFYVTDAEGGKIEDEEKTKSLIEEIKVALGENAVGSMGS
jgi:[protein-PII] uridylyltransferase